MYVEIHGPAEATVGDLANLRELSVNVGGTAINSVGRALAASGLGSFDGEHAWLDIRGLRAAGRHLGAGWDDGFSGMIAYARTHGWLSADDSLVRAHLVHVS